jgi:hypothetical protein
MEGMLASDVLGYRARPTWKAYICEPITEAVERHLSDFRERTMAALCNMCMPPTYLAVHELPYDLNLESFPWA